MRCTKLATAFSLLLITAVFSSRSFGDFGPAPSPSDVGTEHSIVQIADDVPSTDNSAPFVESQSMPALHSGSGAVEQGFSPFLPMGPSNVSPLLRYMQCDPHSCPQVWAGYDAQRLADLHRKCNPHCGCGHCRGNCGHGGAQLYQNACVPCGHHAIKNRYRNSHCESGACGTGMGGDHPVTSGCSSCDGARMDNVYGSKTQSAADIALKPFPNQSQVQNLAR